MSIYKSFVNALFNVYFEDNCRTLDAVDLENLGLKHGVIHEETYDPDRHRTDPDSLPGDSILVVVNEAPAQGLTPLEREALEFYADPITYSQWSGYKPSAISGDNCGDLARKALASREGE